MHPLLQKKKLLLISLSSAILLCTAGFLFLHNSDQRSFDRLTEELFVGELISNTLNLHYTIAYPENYNISYSPGLSIYSPDQSTHNSDELDGLIARLEDISPKRLSAPDAYTYDLLLSYLYHQRIGNPFYLYDEPFSPSSGVQSGLPILLAEYAFHSAADVNDYLAILNQIDDFLNGFIILEQEKVTAGLFMSDLAADKVIEQCDNIMDKSQLAAETHFLQSTFLERILALEQSGKITAAQKEHYIAENNRLLITVVQPAYEKTGDELFLLKGSGRNDKGLYYYPEGQKYYQYLLKSATGSSRDVETVKKLLYQDFKNNYSQLATLTATHPDLSDRLKEDVAAFPVAEPVEVLADLQQRITDEYPPFPSVDGKNTPAYVVKNVSPSMESYSSPAYYLTPPIDYYSENTIYINQKNNTSSLSLFTTLAHEGYPGHLYQTVYHLLDMEESNGNLIRHILHYGGYLEGWALYTEMDSFRYAKQLVADTAPETIYTYDYYRVNRSLQLCMYSLLDIAIHYDGADFSQVQKILATIGIDNEETAHAIYEYIVEEPTNYLKYYLGYLEILELKKEARTLWGPDYSDYKFHEFFLNAGPSDFNNLKKRLMSGEKTE